VSTYVTPYPSGGSISGNTTPCPYSTNTYTVSGVSNATGYTWTVPSGASINSGQGTTSISVTFGSTRGNITCAPANGSCVGADITSYIDIDPTSPTYIGTSVSNANYVSGTNYFVKNGGTSYINIQHSDNCSSSTQYLELTQQPNNLYGSWSLPNIKSYANPNGVAQNGYFTSFVDGLVDNSQLDIQNSQCVSTGNCNVDVNGKWQIVAGAGASTRYHITVYMYDQMGQGVGYTDSGLDMWLDNTLPSTPGTPTTGNGGLNTQTWTTSGSSDGESGVNGSGYEWEWSYDNSAWNTWFTGSTSNSGTWVCDKSVFIRVRSKDNVGNVSTWSSSGNASTSTSSTPPVSISGTTSICSGGSTVLTAVGGTDGTGASYQWFSTSCGGTSAGTGSSISVTPAFTTTYFVRRTGTCNTTSCASAVVSVNSLSYTPTGATATPTSLCTGGTSTLNVGLPSTLNGGLLNYNTWTIGTGSVGDFVQNGLTSENSRITGTDPWGNSKVVWQASASGDGNADGGWNTNPVPIDPTKKYRFSVWVNRTVTGNGYYYLGCGSGNVMNLSDGAVNGNPYFYYGNQEPAQNVWTLVIGYVYPYSYAGTTNDPESGRYTVANGKIGDILNDFKWSSGATSTYHRSYLYYANDASTRQRWIYPRIDLVDGTEPSVSQLLNGFDANNGLGTGASWKWYSGSCGGASAGSGISLPVTPPSSTSYFVRAEGTCNTTTCSSVRIPIESPAVPTITPSESTTICPGSSVNLQQFSLILYIADNQ
jgi:hypothetical protein